MQICRLDAQGSRCGYLDFQRKSWREFLSIVDRMGNLQVRCVSPVPFSDFWVPEPGEDS